MNNEVASLMNNYGISSGNLFKVIPEGDTSTLHYSLFTIHSLFQILFEITLQQALQSLAVAGLVTGHLVDGLQNAAFQAAYLQGAWMAYLY